MNVLVSPHLPTDALVKRGTLAALIGLIAALVMRPLLAAIVGVAVLYVLLVVHNTPQR